MDLINILMDVSTELIAGLIIFVLGFVGARIPYSIERYRLRKFFGNAIIKDDCSIIYGALTRIPSVEGKSAERLYEKKYHDGEMRRIPLFHKIVSDELLRSHAYLVQGLARFRNRPFPLLADEEAFENLNRTFICLGGPITNDLTAWAISEPSNCFLKFSIPEILYEKPITIDVISQADKKLSFESTKGKDYGMILKIRNSRFPTQFFFVCAGIRTSGTSGAAWYLSEHWKSLYKEFGSEEFGIVLEVNRGIFMSAVRVHP
jgi:hypothetical protein